MIGWDNFIWFAIAAAVCWICGAALAWKDKGRVHAITASVLGTLVFLSFIICLWTSLERPPMRTQGETRLWYSFFIAIIGIIVYCRWKFKWILSFSTMMAIVFTCINLLKPEIHSKTLMPALQSPWFVPHVAVYMFAYAMMGAATLTAIYLWWKSSKTMISDKEIEVCDKLVRIGWAFLSMGMVMGALWAKEAWGDYWTWDPKETWAMATWLSYLLYLHMRPQIKNRNVIFAMLIFSFLLLQMCWYGVNFLPSARGSVHTY